MCWREKTERTTKEPQKGWDARGNGSHLTPPLLFFPSAGALPDESPESANKMEETRWYHVPVAERTWSETRKWVFTYVRYAGTESVRIITLKLSRRNSLPLPPPSKCLPLIPRISHRISSFNTSSRLIHRPIHTHHIHIISTRNRTCQRQSLPPSKYTYATSHHF